MDQTHLKFVLIGTIGFIVDAGVLSLLIAAGTGLYLARALSFPVAVMVTWFFHRVWTFRDGATDRPARELAAYFMVQVVGALANFMVYAGFMQLVFAERASMAVPALAIGSVVGLVINFTGSRALVFVGRKTSALRAS